MFVRVDEYRSIECIRANIGDFEYYFCIVCARRLVDKTHLTRILDAISSQNVPIKKLNLGYNKIDDNAVA